MIPAESHLLFYKLSNQRTISVLSKEKIDAKQAVEDVPA
jgi:hypothetical protein